MEMFGLRYEMENGKDFVVNFPALNEDQAKRIVQKSKLKNARYDGKLISSENTDLDKKFLKE